MKKIPYLCLLAIVCAACHGKTQKSTADSIVTDTTTAKDSNTVIIRQFKPLINGAWLSRDYMDAVTHNHSPVLSWEKLGGYSELGIALSDTSKNTSAAWAGLGHHEGINFNIFLQHGHAVNFLKIDLAHNDIDNNGSYYYELGYQVGGADTSLLLYKYNKNRQLLEHRIFTRIAGVDRDQVDRFLNKTLFAGNYINTDTLTRNTEVSFGADGTVSGLGGYKTYFVNADFTGPAMELDQIYFDREKHYAEPPFTFTFKRDTLLIYNVVYSADSVSISTGALRYKLIRKH